MRLRICLKITKMARPHRRPMSKLLDCYELETMGFNTLNKGNVNNASFHQSRGCNMSKDSSLNFRTAFFSQYQEINEVRQVMLAAGNPSHRHFCCKSCHSAIIWEYSLQTETDYPPPDQWVDRIC